jgi:hypothetical protein
MMPSTVAPMVDVYDGKFWREHQDRFLADPRLLALAGNLDWFQPFDITYSLGVFYFVILNLPREVRYLPQNIIIASLIPGKLSAVMLSVNLFRAYGYR